MPYVRDVAVILLVLFSVVVVVGNWVMFWNNYWNHRRGIPGFQSTVPLVSLFAAGIACGLCGLYGGTERLWLLLIPAVDHSNWCFFIALPRLFEEWRKEQKPESIRDDTPDP